MGGFISTYWSPLWDGEFADFTELEVNILFLQIHDNNNNNNNRIYIIQ